MNNKALSPVVSMILILAIITTSISVLWANYVPIVKKRAEIEHNERLIDEFLSILTIYSLLNEKESKNISLKLGGGETVFGRLTTSSTLRVNKTGTVTVKVNNNPLNFNLFSIELSIHNTYLPDRTFVFSEGGIKVFQYNRSIPKSEPDMTEFLSFRKDNNTLILRIDNLTTEPQEVSGNGIAYLRLKFEYHNESRNNCNGSIHVNDSVFGNEWEETMRDLERQHPQYFNFSESDNELILNFTNVNISITVRDFTINIG